MRHRLKDSQCRAAFEPGRLADGDGLYLSVSRTGSKSWVFLYTREGRRREIGLGSFGRGTAPVSLALAREKADAIRHDLATGIDPLEKKRAAATRGRSTTFGEMADRFLVDKAKERKNEKHRAQWAMTLREYAKPLRSKPVASITENDVKNCLAPIWTEKNETARRTRQRIEMVLDYARVLRHREGENPARWKGNLELLLPKVSKLQRGHHAALPYIAVGELLTKLAALPDIGPAALRFTILTAARTGEVQGALWSEIDFDERIWKVSAARMKGNREHRVPLSDAAIDVLQERRNALGDYVFHGRTWKRPMSNMAMASVLKRTLDTKATVHGFRSSFRDWAGDETSFKRERIERCLAHAVGNATELAYRRSDELEQRREIMEAWANYLAADRPDNVVALHA